MYDYVKKERIKINYKSLIIKFSLLFLSVFLFFLIGKGINVVKAKLSYKDNSFNFNNSFNDMKDIALSYYENKNILSEIESSKKITLGNLIEDNKINNVSSNDCNIEKSFIKIVKKDNGIYNAYVKLVCNENEELFVI